MKLKVKQGVIWIEGKPYEKGATFSSPPLSKEKMEEVLKLYKKYPDFFEKEEKKEK